MYTFNFSAKDNSSYDEQAESYSISQFPLNRELFESLEYTDSVVWVTVLKDFTHSLGAFYGYSILDKVAFVSGDGSELDDYTIISDSTV